MGLRSGVRQRFAAGVGRGTRNPFISAVLRAAGNWGRRARAAGLAWIFPSCIRVQLPGCNRFFKKITIIGYEMIERSVSAAGSMARIRKEQPVITGEGKRFIQYRSSIQHGEPIIMEHLGVLHQTEAGKFRNVLASWGGCVLLQNSEISLNGEEEWIVGSCLPCCRIWRLLHKAS